MNTTGMCLMVLMLQSNSVCRPSSGTPRAAPNVPSAGPLPSFDPSTSLRAGFAQGRVGSLQGAVAPEPCHPLVLPVFRSRMTVDGAAPGCH
jgi:hypothetical protein